MMKVIDKGGKVDIVYVDLSRPFVKVPHGGWSRTYNAWEQQWLGSLDSALVYQIEEQG